MPTYIERLVASALLFLSLGCAHSQVAVFRSLPPSNVESEKAWNILIETIKSYYTDIEYSNRENGEIRSFALITDKCWAGIAFGRYIPCKADRLLAKVTSFTPFIANIAVQQREGTVLSNYRNWIETGNNIERENEIYNALLNKLAE
jgi:hypothetical protein